MSSRLLIPVLTGIVFLAAPASAQTASAHAASATAHSTQHHLVKTAHHGRNASLYRRAQLRLKSMGDYAGRVDGRRHASYVRALKRFQTAHHLRASGRLTPKTQRALGVKATHSMAGTPPRRPCSPFIKRHMQVRRLLILQTTFGRPARRVLQAIQNRDPIARDIDHEWRVRPTLGDRLATALPRSGSGDCQRLRLFLVAWAILNIVALPAADQFDPYPFIFINMLLSMLAAFRPDNHDVAKSAVE